MDGFIVHLGLSCTVLSSDGVQLPVFWPVPKIDLASKLIILVPAACTNRFMGQKMCCALRQVERIGNWKQAFHASRWFLWLSFFIFFVCAQVFNCVHVIVLEFVCRVTTMVASFAPFCLGAHYHNPPSERVFHYPFVLSVLMTGNQMDVDKSSPLAASLSIYNTYTQHIHTAFLNYSHSFTFL